MNIQDSPRQEAIIAFEQKMLAKEAEIKETPTEPAPAEPESAAPTEEVATAEPSHEEEDHEDTADLDTGEDTPAPERKNKGVGKRINELTREKYEQQRRAEALEAQLSQMQQLMQQTVQPPPQAQQGVPTLEQFDYDQNAYMQAMIQYGMQEERRRWEGEQQQRQIMQAQQEKGRSFQAKIEAFDKEVPGGWQQAVSAPVNYTPVMLDAIQESDIGPRIGYYLSQHLEEANRISALSPTAQAKAIGRLEEKLSQVPQKKTTTQAPAPAPVAHSAAPLKKNAADMTFEDHVAAVRAKGKRYGYG